MAVPRAVGDRTEDGQVQAPDRRSAVEGVAVVKEADRPQPQLRRLLQDADHLLPHRPRPEHHGRDAPEAEPDQRGAHDALADERQHHGQQEHRRRGAERPEHAVARIVPAEQQHEEHAGRLDAQRKPLDRSLAVDPVDVQEPVADRQGECREREVRADRQGFGPVAGDGQIGLGPEMKGGESRETVDHDRRKLHRGPPGQSQAAGRGPELARLIEPRQGLAVRGKRGLFVGERHCGAPSTGSGAPSRRRNLEGDRRDRAATGEAASVGHDQSPCHSNPPQANACVLASG
jgi:hypothetical protein